MKKFLVILAAIMVAFSICGCNKQIIDLNYKFDKAYIILGDEAKEVTIKSWNDYEESDMVQNSSRRLSICGVGLDLVF